MSFSSTISTVSSDSMDSIGVDISILQDEENKAKNLKTYLGPLWVFIVEDTIYDCHIARTERFKERLQNSIYNKQYEEMEEKKERELFRVKKNTMTQNDYTQWYYDYIYEKNDDTNPDDMDPDVYREYIMSFMPEIKEVWTKIVSGEIAVC